MGLFQFPDRLRVFGRRTFKSNSQNLRNLRINRRCECISLIRNERRW